MPVDIYRYLLYDNYLGIVKRYLCRERAIEYVGGMIIPVGEYGEYGRELLIMRAVGSGWSCSKECDCWSKGNVKLRGIRETVLQVFEYAMNRSVTKLFTNCVKTIGVDSLGRVRASELLGV